MVYAHMPKQPKQPEQNTQPSAPSAPSVTSPLLVKLRRGFISGIIVFAPLAITVFVFLWIFRTVGGILLPVLQRYLPEGVLPGVILWDIVATLVLVALITLLGLVSHYFLGRWFIGLVDRVMRDIPGVKTVYGAVKQIIDTFGSQKSAFSKVVLVEFPCKGTYSIGFLTNDLKGELPAKTGKDLRSVFVPTTPNVTTGFVIFVPKEDLVELDMTAGEGMKMVVSIGAVEPGAGAAAPLMKNEK